MVPPILLPTTLAAGTSRLLINPSLPPSLLHTVPPNFTVLQTFSTSTCNANCVSSLYAGHPATSLLAEVPSSPAALHRLGTTVQSFAYAPGTVRNLHSHWRAYLSFCDRFQFSPIPATPKALVSFLTFCACNTDSYNYVTQRLNSVRLLHLYHGFPCEAITSFPVSLCKKGLKRIMGTGQRQKHPITIDILRRMRQCLDMSFPTHAAIWCLFVVAFFSFLRKSNLVPPSEREFDPSRHLTRGDLHFTDNGAVLRIKWSKTLQFKEGLLLVPLPSIPDSDLCPVAAIQHYFSMVPATPDMPFFCAPKFSVVKPLTFLAVHRSIKATIAAIGLDPNNYSAHSFRRGGASFAFHAGVPDHLIKAHGDWRSDAKKLYIDLPFRTRFCVADIMAAKLLREWDC